MRALAFAYLANRCASSLANPCSCFALDLQAFQFVEEHGEVCPANWTPGAKTMKADPVGSQEYFAAVNKK